MKGNAYGIKINGDFVNCELDCELTVNREIVSKSGSHSGQARHYRYGYYDWQVSVNAKSFISMLKGSFNNILESQLAGLELELSIEARVSNTEPLYISGNVLIPTFTLSFPSSGESTYNVVLKGNGELRTDIEAFTTIINAMPANADKPTYIKIV